MAQLLVRDLDDEMVARLARRARRHGRSIEEVREILRDAMNDDGVPKQPLGSRLRQRFARIGLEDDLPELRGECSPPGDAADTVPTSRADLYGPNRSRQRAKYAT